MKTVLAALLLFPCLLHAGPEELKSYARVQPRKVNEGSALLASRRFPGVFWAINDSGGEPVLYPVSRDGAAVSASTSSYGVAVASAANRDWEALAMDGEGNILIGDIGNNSNKRRDLAVYSVPEPDPYKDALTAPARKARLRYADQRAFPPEERNFDGEAMFWAGGSLYIISKNRADTLAKLYRLESLSPEKENAARLVSRFDSRAMVTDAAMSPDGALLAVLTYEGIWTFGRPARAGDYFSGPASFLGIAAGQCEGIAFDGPGALVVSNEERDLFRVPLSSLKPVR